MVTLFVDFLVLPVAPQEAKQAKATQYAAEDKARLVLAFGVIKVNAEAEDAQVEDDAQDVANRPTRLVEFLQQRHVDHKGQGDQGGIDEVIGCFFGNHGFSI